jgi:hypothetical protein
MLSFERVGSGAAPKDTGAKRPQRARIEKRPEVGTGQSVVGRGGQRMKTLCCGVFPYSGFYCCGTSLSAASCGAVESLVRLAAKRVSGSCFAKVRVPYGIDSRVTSWPHWKRSSENSRISAEISGS